MPNGIETVKVNAEIGKMIIKAVIAVALVYAVFKGTTFYLAKQAVLTEERTNTACPTLFSVARTPRDTLLVMRSEPLCVGYMMKALK